MVYRAHRVYGKKIKQIARETGHSRNTNKKALLSEHSGYKSRIKQPYPVLGLHLKIIDKWLEDEATNLRRDTFHSSIIGSHYKTMQVWKYRPVLLCNHLIFRHVPPEAIIYNLLKLLTCTVLL